MKASHELRWLNVILFFTITLLVMAVFYTSSNFAGIKYNFDQLDKANKTIYLIDRLEINVYKAEASTRLFVINQQQSVISNLYDQSANIHAIRELAAEQPQMLHVIDTLGLRLTERFVLWNDLINLPIDASVVQKAELVQSGDTLTQKIMLLTDTLKSLERDIVQKNANSTMTGVRIMIMLVGGSIFFSILLFLFAFFTLSRKIKREAYVQMQLQRKNNELDRSNKELEQFAYIASHDLQEPLRKIHTYSGRLAEYESGNLSPEGKEIIDKLQGFAKRMQRLIDDLLSFSRILQQRMPKAMVDLNKILNDTVITMSAQIQASKTKIDSDTLPVVMGHESQLIQLFQNLIGNSIKYHRQGIDPQITVRLSMVRGGEIKAAKPAEVIKKFYKISFLDNGIGFDNENADRIFVIFQRLHGRSEYEGTGIGLAICKLVMGNHDGYIYASGREGEGAEFTICIPVP